MTLYLVYRELGITIYAYVDNFYRTSTLRAMWGDVIMPIAHPSTWDVPSEVSSITCLPPPNPKHAGRPRFSRKSAGPEGGPSSARKKQVCKRCGETGHNRITCTVYMDMPEPEPEPLPDPSANLRRRAPKKCSICKSAEHLKNKCPFLSEFS
jgi:hypothetical protein